jgi:hypothetical protein
MLGYHCSVILLNLFGEDNRCLREEIYQDWVSNGNCEVVALLYRLDQLVGWYPKTSYHIARKAETAEKGGDKNKNDKFCGNLWEAY